MKIRHVGLSAFLSTLSGGVVGGMAKGVDGAWVLPHISGAWLWGVTQSVARGVAGGMVRGVVGGVVFAALFASFFGAQYKSMLPFLGGGGGGGVCRSLS